MSRGKTLLAAIALSLLAGPAGFAAEEVSDCQKKIGIKGRPHKLNSVASLSAVRAWSQKAMKHGEDYSMWHNADGGNIKCHNLPRSQYFVCFASGKPCRAENVTAASKAN